MGNEDLERIGDYLNGNMSGEERTRFETELVQNKDLAEVFALYRSIENNMRSIHQENSDEESLRQTLKELGDVYFAATPDSAPNGGANELLPSPVWKIENADREEGNNGKAGESIKSGSTLPLWIKLAVAASIIGLVALSIVWFLPKKSTGPETAKSNANNPANQSPLPDKNESPVAGTHPDTTAFSSSLPPVARQNTTAQDSTIALSKTEREALFARYFKPDAPPEQHDEFLNDAYGFYQKDDYAKAAGEFEPVASASPTRGTTPDEAMTIFQARYYQALSYLALGNATKAIAVLKKASTEDLLSQAKVQWYLALAYLKNNEVKESRSLLARLAGNEAAASYRQKALRLQKELGK